MSLYPCRYYIKRWGDMKAVPHSFPFLLYLHNTLSNAFHSHEQYPHATQACRSTTPYHQEQGKWILWRIRLCHGQCYSYQSKSTSTTTYSFWYFTRFDRRLYPERPYFIVMVLEQDDTSRKHLTLLLVTHLVLSSLLYPPCKYLKTILSYFQRVSTRRFFLFSHQALFNFIVYITLLLI